MSVIWSKLVDAQLDDVNVILPNKRVDNSINKLLPKTIFFFENVLLNCCHSVCERLPQGFVDQAETPPTIEVSVRIKQISKTKDDKRVRREGRWKHELTTNRRIENVNKAKFDRGVF